jgi:hypothetical protein
MKKTVSRRRGELRPEYDLSKLGGGVRGKYFKRYSAGTNLVLLQPDVARAFPTGEAVNEALRRLAKSTKPAARRAARRKAK